MMAVTEAYHSATEGLASVAKFFPAEIHIPHHQLRNFISTVYQGRIYFVHNYDIFVLDIETHQRTLVATVPFQARCLAAAHGWVCVGGEMKGDCAFVKIGDDDNNVGEFGHDLIVDMLGREIVNSMSIHKIPAVRKSQLDEVVVLISNNDKSVTLYSLSQKEVLSVLDHPVAMNYASMSPDCTIIAAVGDANEVFFYRRKDHSDGFDSHADIGEYNEYDWSRLVTPKIPSGEGIWDDYSFSVVFSPNGRLCAVSAQGGYITIIDMDILISGKGRPENSMICTFKSSRSSLSGCVRSMSFSPEPWDLLAWTEDHGRIGIADIRSAFVRRQCVNLDRDSAKVTHIEDATPSEYMHQDVKERLKQQHLQRMRALRNRLPVGSRSFGDSQISQPTESGSPHRETMDLDEHEQSILQALQTTIDDVEHHSIRPYSVNYTSSPNIQPSAATRASYEQQLLGLVEEMNSGPSVPQRRNSVVLSEERPHRHLSPPEVGRALMTESPAPMSEDNSTPPMSTNDLTPSNNPTSTQPLPYNIPASDPWHVIEVALGQDRASQQAERSTVSRENQPTLAQVEAAIQSERRLSTRLERQLADERRLSALLRTELEARERLLEARQENLEAEQMTDAHLSPSLERVLQRQLQSEQESGRQRSNELETEIRINSQRVERLLNARDVLVNALLRSGENDTRAQGTSSALPIAASSQPDGSHLESTLQNLDEERRSRRQRIHDLETQVRRAETRVERASVHNSMERAEQRERYHERLHEARFLYPARSGSTAGSSLRFLNNIVDNGGETMAGPSSTQAQTSNGRAQGSAYRRQASGSTGYSTIPRTSELAGRITESDMGLAGIMFQRATMDANGNWISGRTSRMNRPQRAQAIMAALNPRVMRRDGESMQESLRDRGVGTAGIGWSPDGRFLYAGSEEGIFEFKIHTKDRMCFPSVELR